jgi:hypothetical protein
MRFAPTVITALCALACAAATAADDRALPDAARLKSMEARFAPVEVRVDVSDLPAEERTALVRLIEASQYIDALFMRQRWAGNESMLLQLLADGTPAGRARLSYFLLNKGPWSELDEDQPFLPGVAQKPQSGNFYPAGATRDEVDTWMKSLTGAQQSAATGFFTTIRRTPDGKLTAVPYSLEYQGELAEMARLLREAAASTKQPTLKSFLEKRADAFVSNDYYASDVAWMELDASIEPTIGPYEVYEDEWFNFKAAFESFIALTDRAATSKLERFSSELQELENHLPIDPQYRRSKLGGYSPIRVVNVVFAAGDANHGVQTAAFNLPNDERVVTEKGSKRVLLKNFQQAKFEQVLVPISKQALAASDQSGVVFDAFFTHILMHELMHGLGPQSIRVGGRETTVRQELKELSGPLEEAKADISGLWALQYLMDKGVIDKQQEPHAAIRSERCARQGHGVAGELPAGPGRDPDRQGRAVLARPGEDQEGGHRADARHHDAAGARRLRRREAAARSHGGDPPAGSARDRPARGRARRHRAEIRHRCRADAQAVSDAHGPT